MATTLILRTGYVESLSNGAAILVSKNDWASVEDALRDIASIIMDNLVDGLSNEERSCCFAASSKGNPFCSQCGRKTSSDNELRQEQFRDEILALVHGDANGLGSMFDALDYAGWSIWDFPQGNMIAVNRAEDVLLSVVDESFVKPYDTWSIHSEISQVRVPSW